VYSNLGPGDSFSVDTLYNVDGQGWGNFSRAARFTVGPNNYLLDSVDLPLGWYQSPYENNTMYLDVRTDAAGQPGSTLDSTSAGVHYSWGYNAQLTSGNFGGSATLQANTTYWLVATAGSLQALYWSQNSTGDIGVGIYYHDLDVWGFDDDPEFSFAPAFRINGTPAVIPEPGTLALAGLAFGLLGCARRRK
jgi:hypothetical protein